MPKVVIISILGLLLIFSVPAMATHGRALLYGGAGQGKVIFDGQLHASNGMVCKDCHSDIFGTKKKALITMADHSSDKACFSCHNEERAFSDCEGCHRKF